MAYYAQEHMEPTGEPWLSAMKEMHRIFGQGKNFNI